MRARATRFLRSGEGDTTWRAVSELREALAGRNSLARPAGPQQYHLCQVVVHAPQLLLAHRARAVIAGGRGPPRARHARQLEPAHPSLPSNEAETPGLRMGSGVYCTALSPVACRCRSRSQMTALCRADLFGYAAACRVTVSRWPRPPRCSSTSLSGCCWVLPAMTGGDGV